MGNIGQVGLPTNISINSLYWNFQRAYQGQSLRFLSQDRFALRFARFLQVPNEDNSTQLT